MTPQMLTQLISRGSRPPSGFAPPVMLSEERELASLLERAQGGDREAFVTVCSRYFEHVYGYLRVALKDAREAEEATQQVFISAYHALASYEPRDRFEAWLLRIAHNKALGYERAAGRVEPEDSVKLEWRRELDRDADLRGLDGISDQALWMLIERLPNAERQVLVLRYMRGFSLAEVGKITKRSPEAVRQLDRRSLDFLCRLLEGLGRELNRAVL